MNSRSLYETSAEMHGSVTEIGQIWFNESEVKVDK